MFVNVSFKFSCSQSVPEPPHPSVFTNYLLVSNTFGASPQLCILFLSSWYNTLRVFYQYIVLPVLSADAPKFHGKKGLLTNIYYWSDIYILGNREGFQNNLKTVSMSVGWCKWNMLSLVYPCATSLLSAQHLDSKCFQGINHKMLQFHTATRANQVSSLQFLPL